MRSGEKTIRVAVILIKDGKILVVKSKYSHNTFYLCPGGQIEGYETIAEAARREIKEETNYDIEVGELLYVQEWINPKEKANVLDIFFAGRILSGEETHLNDPCIDKGVIQKIEWINIDELHKIDFEPETLIPHLQKDWKNGFKNRIVYVGHSK